MTGTEGQDDGVRPGFAATAGPRGAGCAQLEEAFGLWTGPLPGWGWGAEVPWELPEHIGTVTEETHVPEKPVSHLQALLPHCACDGGHSPFFSSFPGPTARVALFSRLCDPALVWSGCHSRFSEPTFVVRPSSEAVLPEPSWPQASLLHLGSCVRVFFPARPGSLLTASSAPRSPPGHIVGAVNYTRT